jgi:hypothetical protein
MAPRLDLQEKLKDLLGSNNVYFQPPPSVVMQYPCIVYQRDSAVAVFADNQLYKNKKRYQVTVIDKDPDSDIPDKVAALPLCSYDRFFTADSLNHDVYNLFF